MSHCSASSYSAAASFLIRSLGLALIKEGTKEARCTKKLHLNINNCSSSEKYLAEKPKEELTWVTPSNPMFRIMYVYMLIHNITCLYTCSFEKDGADLTYVKHKLYHTATPLTPQIQCLIVEIYICKLKLCFWNVIDRVLYRISICGNLFQEVSVCK